MSNNYKRALAYNTKMVERNQNKEGKLRGLGDSQPFGMGNTHLLDEYWIGLHCLIRDTQGTANFTIRVKDFKLRVEPVGNMSVSRFPRFNGMEYNFTFSGEEEYAYIRSVFEAFCLMVDASGRDTVDL